MVINFILYVNGWYWVFYLDKELYKFPGQGEGRLIEPSHDGGHMPEFYSSVTAPNSFTLRACSSSVSVHMLEKMMLSFAISLFFVSTPFFFFKKEKVVEDNLQLRAYFLLMRCQCMGVKIFWFNDLNHLLEIFSNLDITH